MRQTSVIIINNNIFLNSSHVVKFEKIGTDKIEIYLSNVALPVNLEFNSESDSNVIFYNLLWKCMVQLAIKGHKTRGKEVIQLLEMLGGINAFQLDGKGIDRYYFIDINKKIYPWLLVSKDDVVFTLEEFEEKFPYKVGDCVVNHKYGKGDVTQMLWINNEIVYEIHFDDCKAYCKANELCKYDAFKGLLAQELKEHLDNATSEQLEEDWKELEKSSEVGPIADEYVEQYKEGVNLQELERKLDEALEKETTESLNKWLDEEPEPKAPILSNRYDYAEGKCGYVIPDGYEFDYIKEGFQTEIILKPKKPTYPKDYEECFNICFGNKHHIVQVVGLDGLGDNKKLFESFIKLKICRDAYWKIAGEQMGLDKPWEPDYDSGVNKYGIIFMNGAVQKSNPTTNWERHLNKVLEFPTEEMRDAFFDNFKDLIEECKELL